MMNTNTQNLYGSLIQSIMFEPEQLDKKYNSLDKMRIDALTHTPTPLWMAVHLGEVECVQQLIAYANEADQDIGTKTVLTGSIISKRSKTTKSAHSTFDNAFELALRYSSNNQKQHKKQARQEITRLLFDTLHLDENQSILQQCLESLAFKKQYERHRRKIQENRKKTAQTTIKTQEKQNQPTSKDTLLKGPSAAKKKPKTEKPNDQYARPEQDLQAIKAALRQQAESARREQELNQVKAEEHQKIEQRNKFKSNVFPAVVIYAISALTMAYINPYNIGTMLASITGVGLILSISLFIMALEWIRNPQPRRIQPVKAHIAHTAIERLSPPKGRQLDLRTLKTEMNDVTAAPHSGGAGPST
jgi:hypothetical protein